MTHFLSYWKPTTVRDNLDRGFHELEHSASDQYNRVTVGDTVWITTVWRGGYLCVLGPIRVGAVTDGTGVAQHFGTDDFWQAKYHIISADNTAVGMREVDATDLAPRLRFLSKNDRLKVEDGRINAQQLQSLRELTSQSAALLEALWSKELSVEQAAAEAASGFGDPAGNRRVEAAAIDFVTSAYKRDGWQVTSVEQEKVGYDLLCVRGKQLERVEVKGTSSAAPAFIITENELEASSDPHWVLYVITRALSEPQCFRVPTARLESWFRLLPLAYRATPVTEIRAGGLPPE